MVRPYYLNALGLRVRRLSVVIVQKASVCGTCLALGNLHRQQLRKQRQHEQYQLPTHSSQQRRQLRLHLSNLLCASPGNGEDQDKIKKENFDITQDWTYGGRYGVDNWSNYFESCKGAFQSPVDLTPFNLMKDTKLGNFNFTNFDTVNDVSWQLDNNGHTVQVTYLSGDLRVSGGGLPDEFGVVQFHFHWGEDNTVGSEHTINGLHHPMEMHVVTYNLKYETPNNALNYSDGLAVLGVFCQAEDADNVAYQPLVSALCHIKKPGLSYPLTPVPLWSLMPKDMSQYYRYPGSLTTPPCSEIVTWTLFQNPIGISNNQLKAFRSLEGRELDEQTGRRKPLVNNYRPTQPLKGRKIKHNF